PEERFVNVALDLGVEDRNMLEAGQSRLPHEQRNLFAPSLALRRAFADVEAVVERAVRAVVRIHFQNDHAAPAVESHLVDVGEDGRLNLIGADVPQVGLDGFRVFHALDAQLVVDSEHHGAAGGVGQRNDLGGQFFDVAEADFKFQISVFAAPQHSHQLTT